MRFRFWMLIALALMLAALAGCANAPGGGRGGPSVTPGPIKTLAPHLHPDACQTEGHRYPRRGGGSGSGTRRAGPACDSCADGGTDS